MKKFSKWLESLTDQEQSMLDAYGYVFLDKINSRNFEMVLLKAPHFPQKFRYHLAFHRQGKSSYDINQQFSRNQDKKTDKSIGMIDTLGILDPFMNKLVEWLKKYGLLTIASTNDELTNKWISRIIH